MEKYLFLLFQKTADIGILFKVKMRVYPQFSIALAKIYFSHMVQNLVKRPLYLAGTVLSIRQELV